MPNTPEIGERVIEVVASRLHIHPEKITEAARLIADLAVTSIDMVETIMTLEEEFAIEISDRDTENLETVGDFIALIRSKLH